MWRGHLDSSPVEILLVGDRGAMVAAERGLAVSLVAPMVAHTETFPLSPTGSPTRSTQRLEIGACNARDDGSCRSRSFRLRSKSSSGRSCRSTSPAFTSRPARIPPIVTLPPEQLLDQLAEEYVYAELCAAVMLSYRR